VAGKNPFENESRIMINSPKVATYDLQPEMSAHEVASAICEEMKLNLPDFICLNFANADMVGHTGVFKSIVKAVETVDQCLQKVVECGLDLGYSFVILADHGNADKAINEDGSPNTAHTTNPVPVWVLDENVSRVSNGVLADVAPTILSILGLKQPKEMTGKSLIQQ
jgi:2,3-bisphosphoglycerate-independent phosphoglycerate mutase